MGDCAPALARVAAVSQMATGRGGEVPRDGGHSSRSGESLRVDDAQRPTDDEIYKMVRRVGVRAGVGLRKAPSHWDAVDGWTSMVTPHAMPRAWATIALKQGAVSCGRSPAGPGAMLRNQIVKVRTTREAYRCASHGLRVGVRSISGEVPIQPNTTKHDAVKTITENLALRPTAGPIPSFDPRNTA